MCQPVVDTGVVSVSPVTEYIQKGAFSPFPAQELLPAWALSRYCLLGWDNEGGNTLIVFWILEGLPLL